MEVEITSREELEAWLEDKPREWAQVIALRSALRVFPLLADPARWRDKSGLSVLFLATLRSLAVSSASAKIPAEDMIGSAKLEYATNNAGRVADAVIVQYGESHPVAAAARASSAAFFTASRWGLGHALNAARASEHAARAAAFVAQRGVKTSWKITSGDCEALDQGTSPEKLQRLHLWPDAPDWWSDAWDAARKWLSLPDHGFEIWREWYFGRIKGLPHAFADFDDAADEKFYRWIVEQDDDWWNRDAAEVNADIKACIDSLRKTEEPEEGDQLKITNGDDFENWLTDKPTSWAPALSIRAALRAIPAVLGQPREIHIEGRSQVAIGVCRAMALSVGVSRPRERQFTNFQIARAASKSLPSLLGKWAHLDPRDQASRAFRSVEMAAALAGDAEYPKSAVLYTYAVGAWHALESDCRELEAGTRIEEFLDSPAWAKVPQLDSEYWNQMKLSLLNSPGGFDIWEQWWRRRLAGRLAFDGFDKAADEAFYTFLLEQQDGWWDREPAKVNADIKAKVEELRLRERRPKPLGSQGAQPHTDEMPDLKSLSDRLRKIEASDQVVSASAISDLTAALHETQSALTLARGEMDRPTIGHNSGAFEAVGGVEGLIIPADAVQKIEEQLDGIAARLSNLQSDLEISPPTKGEVAAHGRGLAESIDKIREISPEFFKGFESQLGKGLAISLSSGVVLFFMNISGLLRLIVTALGG